jgi:hypothetical protein
MKSKSITFFNLVKEVDEILGKIHSKDSNGQPIHPGTDHWNETRDRLMSVKIGGVTRFTTYPINWSMSEHLILDELCSRKEVHEDHIQLRKDME